MVLQRLINSSDSIIPHTCQSNCRSLYLAFSLRDAMPNGTIINRYDCVGNPFWASRYLTLKHDQQSKPNIQKHIHVGKVLNWKKRKTTFSTSNKIFCVFQEPRICSLPFQELRKISIKSILHFNFPDD